MIDPETGCVLTFNGEIYNHVELRETLTGKGHVFVGLSDTEVLLAAYKEWGGICPQLLNGMFAFAIWDPRERCVFAARDRAGEKPFFYACDAQEFRFASELKALMADPEFERRVDADSLYLLLTLGYVPAPRSIFRGVSKLEPGCALTYRVSSGKLTTWRYWQVPSGTATGLRSGFRSTEDYVLELDRLLTDSVRRQMIADVPLGILLSGGIDSGLVTAIASQVSTRPCRTFTITFPGHKKFDESDYAKRISRHFGTEHVELETKPAAFELLPALAHQYDEPMVDSSMIPTFLVSQLIRRHAKVALGGDGGDELFGGYTLYSRLAGLDRLNRIVRLPREWKRCGLAFLAWTYKRGGRGHNYLPAISAIIAGQLPNARNLFLRDEIKELLTDELRRHVSDWTAPSSVWQTHNQRGESFKYRLSRADFSLYLTEDILTKVDRASMLNSLEVRAPWLDQHIIEFAFRCVPDHLKTQGSQRKLLPKLLARRLFPKGYNYDRKQGFSVPLSAWLKLKGPAALLDIVMQCHLPVIDKAVVQRFFRASNLGTANSERLFGLALLSLWWEHYRPSV